MKASQLHSNNYKNTLTKNAVFLYDRKPDKCPICHKNIEAKFIYAIEVKDSIEVFYQCTNHKCEKCFIGYFRGGYKTENNKDYYRFLKTSKDSFISREFTETLNRISNDFIEIYNQSKEAEDLELDQIAGVGYRKSLEFLIKDYLIEYKKKTRTKIEKMPLGQCIEKEIEDKRIKKTAKNATWLGNDETHYVRKWEDKTIDDMKKLIDAVIHWIEYEVLTDELYIKDDVNPPRESE